MPQVDFYILPSADPLARLDFACKLTEKAWRMGHRIYLHCSDATQRDELDARLWRFKGESFVPHGPAESEPEGQVVLGLGDSCGDHHDLLVNLDLKVPPFAKAFARVAEVVVEDPAIRQGAGEFPFLPRTGLSFARSPATTTLST
jgi:DNA polymerase-3 subunit chi